MKQFSKTSQKHIFLKIYAIIYIFACVLLFILFFFLRYSLGTFLVGLKALKQFVNSNRKLKKKKKNKEKTTYKICIKKILALLG